MYVVEPAVKLKAIATEEVSNSLAKEWDALFAQATHASIHMSRPWIDCWTHRVTRPSKTFILTVRQSGELVGLLPLIVRPFAGTRIAYPIGSGRGNLGVLVSEHTPEASIYLAEAVSSVADFLILHDVSSKDKPTQCFVQALSEYQWLIRRHRRNVLLASALLPDYEDFLIQNKSTKARRNMRYRARALERDYEVELQRFQGPGVSEPVVLRCAEIHAASWLKSRGGAFLCEPFYQELVLRCASAGLIEVWIMKLNGDDAAFAILGISHGICYYEWPAFKLQYESKYSIGQILLSRIIAAACAEGVQEFNFGQGDGEYKRFWSNREYSTDRVVAGRGVRGRFFAWTVSQGLSLRRFRFVRTVFRRSRKILQFFRHMDGLMVDIKSRDNGKIPPKNDI